MARIRSIKPSFFRDWDLYQLEVATSLPIRVAFAGLWTVADKQGRFEWKPMELKPDVLPHDPVDFAAVLGALASGGFIGRYDVEGRSFGVVRSWDKHQRPRNDEEDSKLPAPPENSDEFVTVQCHGKERKGKEREVEGNGESAEPWNGSAPVADVQEALELRASDAPQGASELRVRADDGPVLFTFPTIGAQGTEWRLRRRQIEEWQGLFPGLDVVAECRHALAWVTANPGRRKTGKGMPRFLVGWLTRTVDRRGGSAGSAAMDGGPSKLTRALQKASDW